MSAPIWYDSTETGAPVINNPNGAVVAALRAILVNGFNVKAITSIVVASGVATVTCPGHGFSSAYGKWIKITGASAPALDGVKQQTIVDANTFTYPAPGVADGSYTATDARRAPLGWVETYANGAGTVAIFSRSAVEANDVDLRINETAVAPATVSYVRILMVRGATDVDTFTARAPLEAQATGGLAAFKGANTTAAKHWVCFGSDRDLWLFVADPTATKYQPCICFFDGLPYRPGDALFTCLAATNGTAVTNVANSVFGITQLLAIPSAAGSGVIFSDEAGIGNPEPFGIGSPFRTGGGHGDNASGVPTDPLDFAVAFDLFVRGTKPGARGTVPGVGEPFVGADSVVFDRHQVHSADDGTQMVLVKINYGGTVTGMTAFKMTDWRS